MCVLHEVSRPSISCCRTPRMCQPCPIYQVFVWRHSTATSSFGRPTSWRCLPSRRISRTRLRYRSRRQSLRPLSSYRPLSYILPVTVRLSCLFHTACLSSIPFHPSPRRRTSHSRHYSRPPDDKQHIGGLCVRRPNRAGHAFCEQSRGAVVDSQAGRCEGPTDAEVGRDFECVQGQYDGGGRGRERPVGGLG